LTRASERAWLLGRGNKVADAWRDKQKGFHLAQSNKVAGCRLVKAAAQVKGAKSLE
jgi:hypothetical protein